MKAFSEKTWILGALLLTSLTSHGFELGVDNSDKKLDAICQPCRTAVDMANNPNCQALQASVVAERTAMAAQPGGPFFQAGGHTNGFSRVPTQATQQNFMPSPLPSVVR